MYTEAKVPIIQGILKLALGETKMGRWRAAAGFGDSHKGTLAAASRLCSCLHRRVFVNQNLSLVISALTANAALLPSAAAIIKEDGPDWAYSPAA